MWENEICLENKYGMCLEIVLENVFGRILKCFHRHVYGRILKMFSQTLFWKHFQTGSNFFLKKLVLKNTL